MKKEIKKISIADLAIIDFVEKGGIVDKKGNVISHLGRKLKKIAMTNDKRHKNYYESVFAYYNGRTRRVKVHRIVAFIKFGYDFLGKGIMVRHLDDNGLNNTYDNIELGTWQDNYNDRLKNNK